MAIIRMLMWMSSACYDNVIFSTREIPRLGHCSCHNWTSDPHKGMPSLYVCNYSTHFIDYQKVILDKGAIIIMQIKEFVKLSNRGNL